MKPASSSKTIWAGMTSIVTALVAIIMHYSGALELGAPELGAAWTAALMGVAFTALRYQTTVGIGDASARPKQRKSPLPTSVMVVGLVGLAAGMLMLTATLSACPARQLRGGWVVLDIVEGPPCVIKVTLDGEQVQTIKATQACPVSVTP